VTITVRLPHAPAGLVSNLLGLLGLIAVAVAVGGLTGSWWWTALVGGVFAVALAALAQAAAAAPAHPTAATAKLTPIPKAG